jgi:uncharacterized protein (TIGR02246 family)
MSRDEIAIRVLVEEWFAATRVGDLVTVLRLMTDDVIFMVAGGAPFGKQAFAAASEGTKNIRLDGRYEIQELRVFHDWAYLRNYIELTATPADGTASVRRCGYTLTILRKDADARWRVTRDANLLAAEPPSTQAFPENSIGRNGAAHLGSSAVDRA